MDIKEAIFGRRAVREYTGAAIERETIRLLVNAAVHAPSAVVGCRGLFIGRRESHVGGVCAGIGNLLDWIRPELPQHIGRKATARPFGGLRSRRANHRGAPEGFICAGAPE
jgi:nitroreductase